VAVGFKWFIYSSTLTFVYSLLTTNFQPILAIQNILPPEQNSVGMSLVVFAQTFGGSLFIAFAQTIFSHGLVSGLEQYAPNTNPQTIIKAGVTALRHVVKAEDLPGVLKAYSSAINHDFYLAASSSFAMFIFAWGIGWYSVKKKKVVVTSEA
jgi:hypothetical protein